MKAYLVALKANIVSLIGKYPRIESAIITFVGFFLVDLGSAVQQFGTHAVAFPVISTGAFWALIVAAARSALKELWVWYKTPAQS